MSTADEFRDKATQPNQIWQTDFTYLKVISWGWFYPSIFVDDCSRHIIAWKLCATMESGDVTDTLDLALQASGCNRRWFCTSRAYFQTTALVTSPAN